MSNPTDDIRKDIPEEPDRCNQTESGDEGVEMHTAEPLSFLEEMRRRLTALHAAATASKDDEDSEDEDEWDDGDDEDDEGDGWDDDDVEDDHTLHASTGKVPVGKRVFLRSEFKSSKAYFDAVVKSIETILRKNGIHATPRNLHDGVVAFAFDRTTRGVDIDCHIIVEQENCNCRIEFVYNVDTVPGRSVLCDHFTVEKNYRLRYGAHVIDHSDNEKKFEHSFCWYGAFAEEAFERYWDALHSTVKVFSKELETIASKKLDSDQKKLTLRLIGDLATNLPARVKPDNEDAYNKIIEMLGNRLTMKMKKLLAYIVDHTGN